MCAVCCFIKEQYFIDHASFTKMLDPGNTQKQSHRTYLCIKIIVDGNDYYIPLRNNLGKDVRPYGRIGHSIPSATRSDAGLDYRYALIINERSYIEIPPVQKIPNAQFNKINSDYSTILSEFSTYLAGFKKALKKKRISREALYRESSLINFSVELSI
jgi:protein AbiQ